MRRSRGCQWEGPAESVALRGGGQLAFLFVGGRGHVAHSCEGVELFLLHVFDLADDLLCLAAGAEQEDEGRDKDEVGQYEGDEARV